MRGKRLVILSVVFMTILILASSIPRVYSAATTITFNDRPAGQPLNGTYPAGVNWGTNRWLVSGPWGSFSTNSISYNDSGSVSESFTFAAPNVLISIDAYNGGAGATTVTLSCAGNTTVTTGVSAGELKTITTFWTNGCTTVTVGSTNGWNTNFDNLVYDAPAAITPVTPTPTLTPSPTPLVGTGPLLVYHNVVTDQNGYIVPWYSYDLGRSYDHVIDLVWNFWITMPNLSNGHPAYVQRRIYDSDLSIGGDQIAMALSSWELLYRYTGNQAVLDDMEYLADFYLNHGLSSPGSNWPNIPFPANRDGIYPVGPGFFDRDAVSGEDITQPDKAGSFGAELVTLYKITGETRYLEAAVNIANTLASKTATGSEFVSPLPFKVNASTGAMVEPYTTNWTGTLRLFDALIALNQGSVAQYTAARNTISAWLKQYPLQNNRWGPFFEDIFGYSNTEINADTMAWYILEHPEWDANGLTLARNILDYTRATFGNPNWDGINWTQYGVLPINEQTAYPNPGNSHTSRHASVELIYAERMGDTSRKAGAIRQLNWATYMVNFDGMNRYPTHGVWLTDGYGDYVRHYLRAMAAAPELAPSGENHLLKSSSVVRSIVYEADEIRYTTFDSAATELLKLAFVPRWVTVNGATLPQRSDLAQEGWVYDDASDTLRIRHDDGENVIVYAQPSSQPPTATITTPGAGAIYQAGQTIEFSGTGMDASGAALPPSALTWEVTFHHGGLTDTILPPTSNITGGSFTVPTGSLDSVNVWYRIRLTVTDENGRTDTASRDVPPQVAQVRLVSNPPGLQIRRDGQPLTVPQTIQEVVGVNWLVEALSPQIVGGTRWEFESWSHGQAASHILVVPAGNTAYTAKFFGCPVIPNPAPADAAPGRNYFTTRTPTLTWSGAAWALGYEVQVDNMPDFSEPEYANNTLPADALAVITDELRDCTYHWRVRAKRSATAWGAWSRIETFVVDAP